MFTIDPTYVIVGGAYSPHYSPLLQLMPHGYLKWPIH